MHGEKSEPPVEPSV